jgi:alpha-L-fucosidase 2
MNFKIARRNFIALASAALPFVPGALRAVHKKAIENAAANPQRLVLWYERPANRWVEALPIGNGRLGAMVFGGTASERLQLNEDTLYAGGPYDSNNHEALQALPEARRLIFEGRYKEANDLIEAKMMAHPLKQMPYEPVGDLNLEVPGHSEVRDYRRELDLETAIAKVSYNFDGVHFTREVFASPVEQVIVVRVTGDHPNQINFVMSLTTPQKVGITASGPDTLVMRGENGEAFGIKGSLKFQARVRVLAQAPSSGGRRTSLPRRTTLNGTPSSPLWFSTGPTVAAALKSRPGDSKSGTSQTSICSGNPRGSLSATHISNSTSLPMQENSVYLISLSPVNDEVKEDL